MKTSWKELALNILGWFSWIPTLIGTILIIGAFIVAINILFGLVIKLIEWNYNA